MIDQFIIFAAERFLSRSGVFIWLAFRGGISELRS
jgi:hypothetical protein